MRKIFIDPNNIDYTLISAIVETLSKGGIVALPTETVYGLGVHTDRKEAVDRLYTIKHRPKDRPFTAVIDNVDKVINNYFAALPPFGYRLLEKFWPGPLTVIYYTPNDATLGIRVPAHIVIREVIRELNAPVYLPSANISGKEEAVCASEVETAFAGNIDLLVDSGPSLYAQPSTVIDLTYHPFRILREGVVTERNVIDVFTQKRILFVCTGNTCRSPMAQFLFKKHLEELRPYLKDRYDIISRGIAAHDGAQAAAEVINILREEEGIDARDFSAKRLDKNIVRSADLIFAMEDNHREYILNMEPTAEGRVFSLRNFLPADLDHDVPDPIGRDKQVYEDVYDIIKKAILELQEWI